MRQTATAWRAVGLAVFVIAWGGNQFTPLLVAYRDEAGFSQVDVDVLLGAYVLGLVPALLVASGLVQVLGQRRTLVLGLVAALTGSALLALGEVAGYPSLFAGRTMSGASIGVAMAVGTTWITELSAAPWTPRPSTGAGARRAAVVLTGGLALGPASAGVLAQWTDPGLVWPYLVHMALCLPAGAALRTRAVETRRPGPAGPFRPRLRVPAVRHRRFLRVVAPMAPWVFGSAGIAYAVVPQVVHDELGSGALLFTAALTVATLGTGVAVQPIARRLDEQSTARAVVVSMVLMTVGVALAALTALVGSPLLAVPVALVLGAAYGIAVVSGLLEVQRIARPDELGGLTGVYYSLCYVGFLLPALLAVGSSSLSYPVMLAVVAAVALACTLACASGWSKHLPTQDSASGPGRGHDVGGPREQLDELAALRR